MSGHSKWATTKRAKAVTDAARSRVFTKLAKLITVAARVGGGDPATNVTLRLAMDKAREANMPRDNIERAVARGSGESGAAALEEFTYDAVGPSGSAFIIEGVTDSKNRTLSELRNLVEHHGGKLAAAGSQRWQFDRVGSFTVTVAADGTREQVELAAIDAGATDVDDIEGGVVVVTAPDKLSVVQQALASAGFAAADPGLRFVPKNVLELDDARAAKVGALAEALLEHDDVQNVYSNVA